MMNMAIQNITDNYYKKFIELENKLKKSEEERFQLEVKFRDLVQTAEEEKQEEYRKMCSRYKNFLKEDRKRQERNEKIVESLERIENRLSMLIAKTDRFKMLRKQYHTQLNRMYRMKEANPMKPMNDVMTKRELPNDYVNEFSSANKKSEPRLNDLLRTRNSGLGTLEKEQEYGLKSYIPNHYSRHPFGPLTHDSTTNFSNSDKVPGICVGGSDEDHSEFSSPLHRDYSQIRKNVQFQDKLGPNLIKDIQDPNENYKLMTNEITDVIADAEFVSKKIVNDTQENEKYNFPSASPPNIIKNDSKLFGPSTNDSEPFLHEMGNEKENPGLIPNQESLPIRNLINDKKFNSYPVNLTISDSVLQQRVNSAQQHQNGNVIQPNIIESTFDQEKQKCAPTGDKQEGAEPHKDDESVLNKQLLRQHEESGQINQQHSQPTQHGVNENGGLNKEYNQNSKPVQNCEEKTQPTQQHIQNIDGGQTILNYNEQHEEEDKLIQPHDNREQELVQFDDKYNEYHQYDGKTIQGYDSDGKLLQQYSENADSLQNFDENRQPTDPPDQQYEDNGQPNQQYDENGQLVQQFQEPIEQCNENIQPIQQFDGSIQPFQQYDENGQPIQLYNESGQLLQQYDENGQPLQQYDERDQPNQQYDENGQFIQKYDETGQLLQQYDENNQPIQHYDEKDQLVQQYDESGQSIQQYDESGQILQQYDENGLPIQKYEENGQPLQQYNESGQPVQKYDESGQSLQQYDENGQPILQYDESGQPVQRYDESGQSLQQYDESGQPVQQYDESCQPIQQYHESGQPFQQYDESGQPVQLYDESGQPFQQFDENGQLIQQYNETGQVYQQYDESGQPIQQYDDSGQPIQEYDINTQPVQQQNVAGHQYFEEMHSTDNENVIHYQNDDQFGENIQPTQEEINEFSGEGLVDQHDLSQISNVLISEKQNSEHNSISFESNNSNILPENNATGNIVSKQPKVLEMLDTDTESVKQETKVSNESDFDFSNG